jgi:hypothetical protein
MTIQGVDRCMANATGVVRPIVNDTGFHYARTKPVGRDRKECEGGFAA